DQRRALAPDPCQVPQPHPLPEGLPRARRGEQRRNRLGLRGQQRQIRRDRPRRAGENAQRQREGDQHRYLRMAGRGGPGLFVMELLHYEDEVKAPDKWEKEVPAREPSKQEADLVDMLIKTSTASRFDLGKYRDPYREKLKGEEI